MGAPLGCTGSRHSSMEIAMPDTPNSAQRTTTSRIRRAFTTSLRLMALAAVSGASEALATWLLSH
jgi:hypothetical protein